jgi:hypothetical protein
MAINLVRNCNSRKVSTRWFCCFTNKQISSRVTFALKYFTILQTEVESRDNLLTLGEIFLSYLIYEMLEIFCTILLLKQLRIEIL